MVTSFKNLSPTSAPNSFIKTSSQWQHFIVNILTPALIAVIKNNKVDCSEEKVIELNVFYFDQPMGKGVSFEEENLSKEAVYPDQNTAMYKIMKFVCDDGKFFSKK